MQIRSYTSLNRYVKGTVVAFAYSFGSGALLWSLGVKEHIIYICVGLTYFAFALQILIATAAYGKARMLAAIGTVSALGLLIFVGLPSLFNEVAKHGLRGGFIFQLVS